MDCVAGLKGKRGGGGGGGASPYTPLSKPATHATKIMVKTFF